MAWVSQVLAGDGTYGLVTLLSRTAGVSRQTLYTWVEQGRAALEQAFRPRETERTVTPEVERQVLSLLVEAHATVRGIQASLWQVARRRVSLGTISTIIQEAQRRAQVWLSRHAPPSSRPLALDEMYGNDRRGAYLHIVDTASHAVWAAEGPVPVDTESWTLVLWLAQERGLRWHTTIGDGGAAIEAAVRAVDPTGHHRRDVWHVLHVCAQVQGRLDRRVTQVEAQTASVQRQAARLAAGQRPLGRNPRTDLVAHAAVCAQARGIADALRFLTTTLHDLLEVVVLTPTGLLDLAGREAELTTLVALLDELAATAPTPQQTELARLHRHISLALPGLLAFAPSLDRVQHDAAVVLGPDGVALVAWAWQRRAILAPRRDDLLAQFPSAWQTAARVLIETWETAVRASSAVENWHSILRPHLAVHRVLSPGLLALLVVWHNHRAFARGPHAGTSPLHLSGMTDAPADWLVALGYPPLDAASPSQSFTSPSLPKAA
jgi:transposase-like protein